MAFVWWSYLPESLSARRVMESVVLTLEVILHLVQNYLMGSGCYLKGHTGRFAGAECSGVYSLFYNNRSWTTTFQDDDNN